MTPSTMQAAIDAVYRVADVASLRSVGVTAPGPGDGATTLAAALALRAAAGERETLIVDLGGGGASRLWQCPPTPWSNAAGSAEAAMQTVAPALTLLPAPGAGPIPPILRERSVLADLVRRWSERFDAVIVDLPPLEGAASFGADPVSAAQALDGVVISVMVRRTREAALIGTVETLAAAGVRTLGVVANDRDNPTLAAELGREARRLRRFLPALALRVERLVQASPLLSRRL